MVRLISKRSFWLVAFSSIVCLSQAWSDDWIHNRNGALIALKGTEMGKEAYKHAYDQGLTPILFFQENENFSFQMRGNTSLFFHSYFVPSPRYYLSWIFMQGIAYFNLKKTVDAKVTLPFEKFLEVDQWVFLTSMQYSDQRGMTGENDYTNSYRNVVRTLLLSFKGWQEHWKGDLDKFLETVALRRKQLAYETLTFDEYLKTPNLTDLARKAVTQLKSNWEQVLKEERERRPKPSESPELKAISSPE